MLDILKEVVIDDTVDVSSSFGCFDPGFGGFLPCAADEMTEDELQALEERADRWLMDAAGIL